LRASTTTELTHHLLRIDPELVQEIGVILVIHLVRQLLSRLLSLVTPRTTLDHRNDLLLRKLIWSSPIHANGSLIIQSIIATHFSKF